MLLQSHQSWGTESGSVFFEGFLVESASPRKASQIVRRTGQKCHMETFALQDVRRDSPQMLLGAPVEDVTRLRVLEPLGGFRRWFQKQIDQQRLACRQPN